MDGTRRIDLDEIESRNQEKVIPRILILDPQEDFRLLLRDFLNAHGFNQVNSAANSEDAMDLLRTFKYHLIIADNNLPGMPGMDLLKYIRRYFGSIEVILVTDHPDVDDAVNAVNAVRSGAFDFLAKPVDVDKVLSLVTNALAKQLDNEKKIAIPLGLGVSQLHGYNIIRTLGYGNMGVVVLVEREGKYYAMKILRADSMENSYTPQKIERFMREANVLSHLDHPCVVKVFDFFVPDEDDEVMPYYIVMEFVPGRTLNYYLKKNILELNDKLAIIIQVASALDVVHQQGVLHRDVKPGNVIVSRNLHAKLMDFGVARIANSSLTLAAEIIGSPAYMAPECFGAKDEITERADIFSLGVLSYELLTGIQPFAGDTVMQLIDRICSFRPVAPRILNSDIPQGIQDVLARMLAKRAEERFAEVGEVIQAFNNYKIRQLNEKPQKKSITSIIFNRLMGGGEIQTWQ